MNTSKTSKISKFYEKSLDERLKIIKEFANLQDEDIAKLRKYAALDFETANRMIENVIGTTQFPIGVATSFIINGKELLIPMALEEPSVVAAASKSASLARSSGGFKAEADEPIMIGQIQLLEIGDMEKATNSVEEKKEEIIGIANDQDPTLVRLGGGAKDLEVRKLENDGKKMLIVHLSVDVRDAMGANAVNTMVEAISPKLEEITDGKAGARILTNLATKRIARAKATWKKEELGEGVVDAVLNVYNFAAADPYRATTHNKGIMNGVDAVLIATGNDFRAVEAGAHAYAATNSKNGYGPLTHYEKDEEGNLVGEIALPVAVGLVGGATKTNPIAKIAMKILDVKTSKELAEIIAAVGLAQNFAAIRAIAVEGIQKGHMKLHSKNIAIIAGAVGDEIEKVAARMAEEKKVGVSRAKEILEELRKQ